MKLFARLVVGVLLLAGTPLLPLPGDPLPSPSPPPERPRPVSPTTVTAAVYVYEKDAGPVPAGVSAGIDRLNREKNVTATLFEKDTVDGTGETPEQYKPALKAATDASLPALVVLSGTVVAKTVKAPKTLEDVVGAIR